MEHAAQNKEERAWRRTMAGSIEDLRGGCHVQWAHSYRAALALSGNHGSCMVSQRLPMVVPTVQVSSAYSREASGTSRKSDEPCPPQANNG